MNTIFMTYMKNLISNKIGTGLVFVISAAVIFSMVTQLVPTYVLAAPVSSSNQSMGQQIDSAITAIQGGNTEEGRKQLLQSEKLLEDVPSASAAEKHIEAALQALKQGDNTGSITHAEEAKKMLSGG
jgi:predicted PurR-regulated permease PerM